MAEQLTREQIARAADISAAPPVHIRNAPMDRTFELPVGVYATTVALYLGFIALLGVSFANPGMLIPAVLFTLIVIAGFGLPTIWTVLAPDNPVKPRTWAWFRQKGVMTASGRASARDAAVQVLILPVLIFVWGLIVVTIAALA